jgi:GNAT superfamily N-acetyltransferase
VADRVAGTADVPALAETLAGAFFADPVWGWAFADADRRHEQQVAFWSLFLEGSVEFGWVRVTEAFEAVALWIPPGRPDLTEPHAARLSSLVRELVGERAELFFEVLECFDRARPSEAHYYLSLLGTHPEHRGHGFGMRLLAENLAEIDRAGLPAYLESTNPVNVARYEAVGFAVSGGFELPADGPNVTTMRRAGR